MSVPASINPSALHAVIAAAKAILDDAEDREQPRLCFYAVRHARGDKLCVACQMRDALADLEAYLATQTPQDESGLAALIAKIREICADEHQGIEMNLWPISGGMAMRYVSVAAIYGALMEATGGVEAAVSRRREDRAANPGIRIHVNNGPLYMNGKNTANTTAAEILRMASLPSDYCLFEVIGEYGERARVTGSVTITAQSRFHAIPNPMMGSR